MRNKKDYIFLAKIFNPLVLLLYGIICFYLYSISRYGGVKRKVPIILSSMILLTLWFSWCFYKKHKQTKARGEGQGNLELTNKEARSTRNLKIGKLWFIFACFIIITTSFITGKKIYQSASPYNGKLSWFIQDLKNKKEISLPIIEVPLGENQTYEPFDFPEMPYEEDGKLMILVSQGQDGDY